MPSTKYQIADRRVSTHDPVRQDSMGQGRHKVQGTKSKQGVSNTKSQHFIKGSRQGHSKGQQFMQDLEAVRSAAQQHAPKPTSSNHTSEASESSPAKMLPSKIGDDGDDSSEQSDEHEVTQPQHKPTPTPILRLGFLVRFMRLPDELHLLIYSYMPAKDIDSLRQSCKALTSKITDMQEDILKAVVARENKRFQAHLALFDFKELSHLQALKIFCQNKDIWAGRISAFVQAFKARFLASKEDDSGSISERYGRDVRFYTYDLMQLYLETHHKSFMSHRWIPPFRPSVLGHDWHQSVEFPKSFGINLDPGKDNDVERVKCEPGIFGQVTLLNSVILAYKLFLHDWDFDQIDKKFLDEYEIPESVPKGMRNLTSLFMYGEDMDGMPKGDRLPAALGIMPIPRLPGLPPDFAYCTDSMGLRALAHAVYEPSAKPRSSLRKKQPMRALLKAHLIENLYLH
jgi:hypothetical protein